MAIRKRPDPKSNVERLEEDLDKYIAKSPQHEPNFAPHRSAAQRHTGRRIFLTLLVLVLLAGTGAGGYWLGLKHQPLQTVQRPAASTKPESTGNTIAHYTASGEELKLSFDYPSNWRVSPQSPSHSDKPVTVTSPLTSIIIEDGTSVMGRVTVTIRPGSATVTELDANNPVVAQTSYQVAYTAPGPSQNKYPYLTFIHYDNGSKTEGAFEQVIVTGVRAHNRGEVMNSTTLVGLDPITSAAFVKCSTPACTGTNATRLGITDTTWQNLPIFKQTLAIFESLKID